MMKPLVAILARSLRRATVVCVAYAGVTMSMGAQTVPFGWAGHPSVLLQHGFRSNPDTWAAAKDSLARRYDADFYAINTDAKASFVGQAVNLIGQYSGNASSTVYVGHSNGGVVGRVLMTQGKAWKALVTVASPNAGAVAATNVLSGHFAAVAYQRFQSIGNPLYRYSGYWTDDYHWHRIADIAGDAWLAGYFFSALPGVFLNNNVTILADMTPPSATFALLNSPGTVSGLLATVPDQTPLIGRLASWDGIWWRTFMGSRDDTNIYVEVRDFIIGVYLAAYVYYQYFPDYSNDWWLFMQEDAWMWLEGAYALAHLDLDYCAIIGAKASEFACANSDGIVPESSQMLPGVPVANQRILFDVSHGEETRSLFTLNELKTILQRLGVRDTSSAPVFTVGGLQGPTATSPEASDLFSVAVSGGLSPYAINWSVDGTLRQSGSSASFVFVNLGADYFVSAQVTDALGASITRARSVTVVSCGGVLYC